jgi:hypothetical protein
MKTLKTIAAIATFALMAAGSQAQSSPPKFPTVVQQPEYRHDGNPSGTITPTAARKKTVRVNQQKTRPTKTLQGKYTFIDVYPTPTGN